MTTLLPDVYISVDIEASGPVPSRYSMVSIGACLVDDPDVTFYAELKPDNPDFEPSAMAIHGLTFEHLEAEGADPQDAMNAFAAWITAEVPAIAYPVFVGFNAPFDWMFVSHYFHRYVGSNPFGHAALDIKAYFMGLHSIDWSATGLSLIQAHYGMNGALTHHALDDAQVQARLFKAMLAERGAGTDGGAEE